MWQFLRDVNQRQNREDERLDRTNEHRVRHPNDQRHTAQQSKTYQDTNQDFTREDVTIKTKTKSQELRHFVDQVKWEHQWIWLEIVFEEQLMIMQQSTV